MLVPPVPSGAAPSVRQRRSRSQVPRMGPETGFLHPNDRCAAAWPRARMAQLDSQQVVGRKRGGRRDRPHDLPTIRRAGDLSLTATRSHTARRRRQDERAVRAWRRPASSRLPEDYSSWARMMGWRSGARSKATRRSLQVLCLLVSYTTLTLSAQPQPFLKKWIFALNAHRCNHWSS